MFTYWLTIIVCAVCCGSFGNRVECCYCSIFCKVSIESILS